MVCFSLWWLLLRCPWLIDHSSLLILWFNDETSGDGRLSIWHSHAFNDGVRGNDWSAGCPVVILTLYLPSFVFFLLFFVLFEMAKWIIIMFLLFCLCIDLRLLWVLDQRLVIKETCPAHEGINLLGCLSNLGFKRFSIFF